MTAEEAVRGEHQRQGVTQVSVANAITSLRLCSEMDWREYVESVSLVEHTLRRNTAGVYGRMDFLSRNQQRHAVEQIARRSGEAQLQLALTAVEGSRSCRALQQRAEVLLGQHGYAELLRLLSLRAALPDDDTARLLRHRVRDPGPSLSAALASSRVQPSSVPVMTYWLPPSRPSGGRSSSASESCSPTSSRSSATSARLSGSANHSAISSARSGPIPSTSSSCSSVASASASTVRKCSARLRAITQPTLGMFRPKKTRENGCSFERWIDSKARVAEISA